MYTGTLNYKGIDFTFVTDNNEKQLRLIPPADKLDVIQMEWKMKKVGNGAYVNAAPIEVTEKYIVGECVDSGSTIVFILQPGSYLGFINLVVTMELNAIIAFPGEKQSVSRISFLCPELNIIFPTNQCLSYYEENSIEKNRGTISVKVDAINATEESKCEFEIDDKQIKASYGISSTIHFGAVKAPIELASCIYFDFEETEDYTFLYRLYTVAKSFLSLLCYRKNIVFMSIPIFRTIEHGRKFKTGEMYVLEPNNVVEKDAIKKRRMIKQQYLCGKDGEILKDIASGELYMRHIASSYEDSLHLNEAKVIMLTAAFEWEFKRLYPDGIHHKQAKIDAISEVKDELDVLLNTCSGNKKKIYKYLKSHVDDNSLKAELITVYSDYKDIIDVFSRPLYRRHNEVVNYKEIADRLSEQRNHFAHGHIDKEFSLQAFLDVILLERVIYIMQLSYYGIEKESIKKAVNDLFECGAAL